MKEKNKVKITHFECMISIAQFEVLRCVFTVNPSSSYSGMVVVHTSKPTARISKLETIWLNNTHHKFTTSKEITYLNLLKKIKKHTMVVYD